MCIVIVILGDERTKMRGVKYQITLAQSIAEKLEKIAKEKGLSKSGAIALAIGEMTKRENSVIIKK